MNTMDKIAVIIPCYNEGLTIYKVVQDFQNALPGAAIYVYDNNSSDNTFEEAKRGGAVVRKEQLQGKGNVLRRALREADAHCYLIVDGDDTYPAKNASELYGPMAMMPLFFASLMAGLMISSSSLPISPSSPA